MDEFFIRDSGSFDKGWKDRSDWEDSLLRRRIAAIAFFGAFLGYAIGLGADAVGEYGIADKWWVAAGPVAGYVLKMVMEGRPPQVTDESSVEGKKL
jgi:hypothetical protein